jgi:CRISPR-associated exonuclease Cas4
MTVPDDDYEPIGALNDLLFCERRCAMHRIEQVWMDNPHTLEGTRGHGKVHREETRQELPGGGWLVRGMWLRSQRLKLIGKADVVEFRPGNPSNEQPKTKHPETVLGGHCSFPAPHSPVAHPTVPIPYPVEYKRGRRRKWDNDDVQLCAQALCLEEMLGVDVPAGAIFHVKSKRRREVPFDEPLRQKTADAARRLHQLVASGVTPPAVLKPRCQGCSLRQLCMPELLSRPSALENYSRQLLNAPVDDNVPADANPAEPGTRKGRTENGE